MAEENKLIYYVEINTEKGIKDALEKLDGFNKKAQATLKGITGKSSANVEVEGLKKQLDELSKAWNDYNIAQRKGASGSETLSAFRDINNEAGIYAGNIRQVVKAQNEQSESATVVYKMLQALRKEFRGLGEEQLKDPKVLQEYVNRFNEIKSISEAAGLSIDQYVGKLQKQSTEEEKLAIKQEELAKKMATVIGQRDALNKTFRDMTPELQTGTAGQNIISQMTELNTQYGHLFKSASQIVQEQDKLNISKQKEIEFLNTTEGKYAKLEALWKDLAASQKGGKQGSQLVAQMEALDAVYKETDVSLRKYTDTIVRSREEEEKKSAILSTYAGQVGALSDAWNKLTIAERKGKEGQELITQFDKLKNDAGVYAGSLEQVATSQRKLATGTANANKQFSLQSNILMQLKAQMGMYLSTYALIRFAKNVRDITGEFELQRVALTAILQDKEAADKIYGQILVQALESPFRIKDIVSYTKQLAAYRVETDKLFETTKRLADISAGLGVDMDRLVLAYGQVRAASVLRGQELRQFTEAGIPLVKLLADKFSELRGVMVSTGEVFSLISQRAVPFRMIEEIFNDMTDAGGIFYDMQKIQAQTVRGIWVNLADAYDKMYYEIGQKNEGLLKGLGLFLRNIADNWEKVYNGLSAVTAGYVAYLVVAKLVTKSTVELTAAQLANIAADGKAVFTRLSLTTTTAYATKVSNAYMAAQYRLAASTNFLSKAFYKLWSAILLNPIAAAVAVIVGLGVAIGGAVIKANSLDSIIKRLNKSTAEYKTLTEDVGGAIKIFNKLNGAVGKTEQETKKLDDATNLLAERYPSARQNVEGYSNSVKIAADKVNELYQAELKLRNLLLEKDYNALLQKEENLKNKIAFLDERIARANASGDLSEGKKLIWEKDKFVKDLAEASKTLDQWHESLYGGKRDGRATPKDLFGIQDYVNRIKSIFKNPTTGKDIKLYDSKEDIQAFATETELLEDIAKKYKAAATEAEYYAKKKDNPEIEAADRANAANAEKVYRAEMKLAYSALERYDSLGLISDFIKKNSKDEVDILYDQINTAKDARAAYEGYLKVMNEVRAKQTVEDQLKFAGIKFDVADSGSYRAYLQNVYDNIKNDPNYSKVSQLIKDILVDFDIKSVETELKNKLDKIANDIAKTQKANDFFEKILGITGDIELSKKLTIKYTGVEAQETAQKIKEQLQMALRDVKGDDTLDITKMSLQQIQDLIDEIPDTASDKRSKVESFFEAFKSGGQDALFKMWELDNALRDLSLDDSALFGTGVTLDVQKIVRDLSVGNKKLALEKTQLEAKVAADTRASDKAWYDQQMKFIDDLFRQREANEKTLAQDKLNELAKSMFEEQKRILGLDNLLSDMNDKTLSQVNEALSIIEEMKDVKILQLSDSTINILKDLNIEIDNLKDIDLGEVFKKTGDAIPDADKSILGIIQTLKILGLTTGEAEAAYRALLDALATQTKQEQMKKQHQIIKDMLGSIEEVVDEMGDWGEVAGAVFSKIKDIAGSLMDAKESGYQFSSVLQLWLKLVSMMMEIVKFGVGKNLDTIDAQTKRIEKNFSLLVEDGGKINSLLDDQVMKYMKLNEAVSTQISKLNSQMTSSAAFASDVFPEILESILGISTAVADGVFKNIFDFDFRDLSQVQEAILQIDEALTKTKNRTNISYLENAKAQLKGIEDALIEMEDIVVDLVGDMTSSVMDAMVALANGSADALSNFAESMSKSLEDIIQGRVFSLIMSGAFTKFESDIKAALKTGDVNEMIAAYSSLYDSMIDNQAVFTAQLELAKSIAAEYGIVLFDSTDDVANETERLLGNIKAIDDAILQLKERSSSVDTGLLEELKQQAAVLKDYIDSFKDQYEFMKQWEQLLANEPAINSPERQTWEADKAYLQSMMDNTFSEHDYIENVRAYEALLSEIAGMEERLSSADAIKLLKEQRDKILKDIYSSGYDKYATDEMKQEDTLKEYLSDMELYNQLAAEATDPEQQARWKQLADLAQAAFDSAVLEDFNTKLDESLSGIDDNYEKMEFLQKMLASLSDQSQIDEVTKQIKELKDTIFTDLYSTYATDSQKYIDQLAEMEKHLKWAIENGYPELAKWIQEAYDTTVVDKWIEKMDEAAGNVTTDLDKWKLYVREMQITEAAWLEAIMAGQDTTTLDKYMVYLQGVLSELRKSLKDGIWSDYATDAQKYEQELVDINKDLEWAIRNYPDLADEISDAFNTSVLKNWQDAWDDAFEDFDTSFQKWQAIQQELGNLGTPNITKDEAIKGRDSALVDMGKYKEGTAEYAAAKAAYDYYQAQLILHMKINELLIQQADIEDELYDKYRSGEQEYADDIAEREADIKTLEGIRDQFAPDTKEWERWNDVVKNAQKELRKFVSDYNLDGLTEEFNSTFGDITDLSTKKVKEMLEAFREQILSSTLSDDAKKEAFALIDDIYDQLDERTQEAFENIESAVNSLSSLLESFGADENIINSFKGIETAIGGVAQIVTGVVSGNWFTVLAGIAKLISGFINAIKSLITFFKGDPLAGLEAIATTVTNAQNAVEKAIGTAKSQEQARLLATYAQAISQIDEAISSESGKKDTWWTRLLGTAPDKEAIEKLKEQREEYEKLMEEVQESMKADFLQTDYMSFSDALADILIRPWDSYMEMMDAVRELTDQTINDIVRHALSLQLQQQVNDALKTLYESGISDQSLDKFDEDIENIVAGYAAYQEALGKYFTGDVGSSTAYDTISRITEAQANSFLGYYQNYLIIMTDMSNVLKRIFDSMSKISVNVNLDGYLNTLQAIAANTAITARYAPFLETMAADIKTLKNSMTRSGAY